jgi:hypothetical protein
MSLQAELARLIDFAERPRTHDWSMRAALCRYAQPQPVRVSTVLDLVRRIEFALQGAASAGDAYLGELLRAASQLDHLGDTLAEWAVDRDEPRPDGVVDAVTADVARRLEALGVPHEDRPRPTRPRG